MSLNRITNSFGDDPLLLNNILIIIPVNFFASSFLKKRALQKNNLAKEMLQLKKVTLYGLIINSNIFRLK